jgi:2-polyprenyl-3-methyl-5-hydroxy-6-metoxy-1,4-benzoquinol methylase
MAKPTLHTMASTIEASKKATMVESRHAREILDLLRSTKPWRKVSKTEREILTIRYERLKGA